MLNKKYLPAIILSFFVSSQAIAKLDLSSTVNCTYRVGQILDKDEANNVTNNKPLNWTFNGLLSEAPLFVAGGDTGAVFAVKIAEGIVIYLPDAVGTSTFSIWDTGESFWSKQTRLLGGVPYSQHFLGSCVN